MKPGPAGPVTGFSDRSGSLVILVAGGGPAGAWHMPSGPDVPNGPDRCARSVSSEPPTEGLDATQPE